MVYNTPALVLIGAAASLVLGSDSLISECRKGDNHTPFVLASRDAAEW